MSKTAMQIMYDELMQHEYTIPLELIVRCKELIDVEKEQIEEAYLNGCSRVTPYGYYNDSAKQYYNETYNK